MVSKKRILVTGATGFIGSHLIARLIDEAANVGAIIRKIVPSDKQSNLQILQTDLLDFTTLQGRVRKFQPDVVYHLAGVRPFGNTWQSIQQAYQTNFLATMNLLRSLEGINTQAIILIGSAAEYGKGAAPYREEQTLRPISAYGASKAAATILGLFCHEYFKLPIIIVRPSVVYGPGQGEHFFLSQMCKTILDERPFFMSPGDQYRDFIYISDVVDALLLLATKPEAVGGIFNIGSGISYPLRYIAELASKYLGGKNLLRVGAKDYAPDEQYAYVVNIHLAQQVLKWQPRIGLEEGLAATIEWYKSNK